VSLRLDELAARKELVVARLQLQRMETALRVTEVREALRPVSRIGSAIARPAAVIGILDLVAPLLGLGRIVRWARVGAIAMVVFKVARNWRGRQAQPQDSASGPDPEA
jgi:hypothetical protein